MKLRNVLIFAGGVLVCALLVGGTTIATTPPRGYKFMGDADAVRVIVEEDGGPFGREARFYLINKPVAEVLAVAEPELTKANFKVDSGPVNTSCFQRGKGDRVEIHSAFGCGHDKVVNKIPEAEKANWTVVKTIDPRIRRAVYRWMIEYGKHTPQGQEIVKSQEGTTS